jgi:PPM family protein phosphatase
MKALDDVLEFGALTDPGMVRANNEDALIVEPGLGLAILADGMGGGNAGEVASGMATTLLAKDLGAALKGISPGQSVNGESRAFGVLRDKIAIANRSIFQTAEHQPQYVGMGTTLVVTLFYDNRVAVAHIGDSRVYRVRDGAITQMTRDHSLLQMQLDAGVISPEEAKHSKQKNIVVRALGIEPEVETEIHEYPVARGDVYVLCSDGLHDMVDEQEIVRALARPRADLQSAAEDLIKTANANGGRDNISVVLIKVLGDFGAPKGWLARFFAFLR